MSAALIERAPAKINLTLRVLGRRADGYHDLESLVAFADLSDTLTLQPALETGLEVTGPFAAASGKAADNLVLKALSVLDERIGGLKGGRFLLEKTIPVAAGIGGGSADAAAALRLMARANGLALDDARLMQAALSIGADVPVCFAARARIMGGVGERLSLPLELPVLPALLVNPGVFLATRDVFAAYTGTQGSTKSLDEVPREQGALIEFLKDHGNDLTQAALVRAPVIADVLAALHALPGARLSRMSGSGPTCFALFTSCEDAVAGASRLSAERKDWWVVPATLG